MCLHNSCGKKYLSAIEDVILIMQLLMYSSFLNISGGLIFLIGFSGCVGAIRENTCFLALYSTIIGLLLLAEMALVVLVFASKDWITQEFFIRLDDTVYLIYFLITVIIYCGITKWIHITVDSKK